MKRIGMGIVGAGFVGPHHIDAVRRLGFVDVVAIAGSSDATAKAKAEALGVPKAYGSYDALLNDPAVEVVHNATPDYLHQNELWIGRRDAANEILQKDPDSSTPRFAGTRTCRAAIRSPGPTPSATSCVMYEFIAVWQETGRCASARVRHVRRRLPRELHCRSDSRQREKGRRLDEGELLTQC